MTPLVVVVVVVVEVVDVVVDVERVTWIFLPICDENMTRRKDSHPFVSQGKNSKPSELSDIDDCWLIMMVQVVISGYCQARVQSLFS